MKPGVGLIARKLGITQLFREDGRPVPVTVLEAGPCTVVRARTVERDGYRAVQLGFGPVQPEALSKPLAGQFRKVSVAPQQILREFRLSLQEGKTGKSGETVETGETVVGSTVTVEIFRPGDRVDVTGTSVGKGFQGGVKRWHWKGGPQTHGSMSHRAPGSIGSSTNPSRVFKGHHLPGRMGGRRVTTQALEVVRVEPGQNLLLIKGAVPGFEGGVVLVRRSRKPPRLPAQPAPAKKKAAAAPKAAAKAAAPAKSGSGGAAGKEKKK